MPHRRFFRRRVFTALFCALFILAGHALPCLAADAGAKEKDAPLRVKVVDIKGTKVRLPIPDGFEEMQREDHPETYDWMKNVYSDSLELIFLINSDDKKKLSENKNINFKYGMLFTPSSQLMTNKINKKNSNYALNGFTEYIQEYIINYNKDAINEKRSELEYFYIFKNDKSASVLFISKEKEAGYKSKECFSRSFFVINNNVLLMTLYHDVYDDDGVKSISHEIRAYMEKMERSNY